MTDNDVTVVIADDDANVRDALDGLLGAAPGVKVVAMATTAAEAVAACADNQPDVALLDVQMPGDGIAAARDITEQSRGTTVVMLTALDSPELRLEAAANGATHFVVKSDGDDLIEIVRRAANG